MEGTTSIPGIVADKLSDMTKRSSEWIKRLAEATVALNADTTPAQRLILWAELEPLFAAAIKKRVRLLQRNLKTARRARKQVPADTLRTLAARVEFGLLVEHRALVDLYYQLKAGADDADPEAQVTGEVLSSKEDIDAYFERARSG